MAFPAASPAGADKGLRESALAATPDRLPLVDKRVLIIDPFEASRSILKDTVGQLGCKAPLIAGGYTEGMRTLRRNDGNVDLVFCEYNLNGNRDGQQLLEEVRSHSIISLATSFFMVTGESGYRRVVSVAEFAPDDYVVKPYSVEHLRQRILRTMRKKLILGPTYALIESGETTLAIEECLRVGDRHPEYVADAWRIAIDLLTTQGQKERAEMLLARLIETRAIPWAALSLARIRLREGSLIEAERMLEGLLEQNPQFLSLRDTLAEVRMKMGKSEEALAIIEQAAEMSSANVTRLRRVAEIAEALGDMTKAELAYGKVLERTRDSSMLTGEDYANLSRTLVAQGKLDDAARLAGDQRKMMKGHRDLELSAAMLDFHRVARIDRARVAGAVQKLIDIEARDTDAQISPRLVVQVVRACLQNGQDDAGLRIAGRMARRENLDAGTLQEVRELLDQHRAEQLRNKYLSADEMAAAIAAILEHGFDDEVGPRIERSLVALHQAGDADGRLEVLARQWAAAKAKYGVAR
ncbi:MAG TPA: response regulator [Burkholderiaceae bacterium]|nr:response regulator [Burkholderiaceae bacterium]